MKVCVTGGAGFIGSSLVRRLLKEGHDVLVWDNFSRSLFPMKSWISWVLGGSTGFGRIKMLLVGGVQNSFREVIESIDWRGWLGEFLREEDGPKRVLDGVDVVFHLAALTSVSDSWLDIEAYEDVNALGTLRILQYAKEAGVKRVVYASTAAVYGGTGDGGGKGNIRFPRSEGDPPLPLSPYALTKLQGEHFCRLYGKLGLPFTILRFFNVFGPYQKFREASPYSSVIPTFLRCVLNHVSPIIYGDGLQTRDFLYVEDVVEALIWLSQENGAIGEIYNVGSGRSCSISDLWELIQEVSGRECFLPGIHSARLGEIRHNLADIHKIRGVLGKGWPRWSLEKGLRETFSAFQTGAIL